MHAKPALFVLLCTLLSASIASATTDFRVLADLDNNSSTGCTVSGMPGVERVLTTTLDTSGTSPRVTSVTEQDCSGTSLSSVVMLDSTGWPATTNATTGVSIIETQIPLSAFGSPLPHVMRLGFVMTSGSQTVSILTDADGNPFLFPGNGGKHRIVGAASRSFTADGNPADWAGIAPFANGDSNEANTFRIINVFGFLTKNSAFFRFDAQSHASAPTARNDSYSTPQSTPLSVSGPGVLGNDTDPNNLPLSAIQVSSPDRGALVLNADGSFTYTPDGAAPGHEVFTYQATNGTQPSNVARVEIRVGQTNHAPNAGDDNYNVLAGGTINAPAPGVLANDTDPDGDSLHAVLRNSPLHGTVTLNNDGSFIYVNDGSSLLDDEFTYVASDGVDVSREATVHIHVGTNDAPPVAVNDDYTVAEGGTLTVPAPGVLANDHDSDTPSNQLSAVLSAGPQHGTVTLTPNGSFIYVHDGSETTSDFFTYRVYDHQLFSNIATVHITITPVNDAPTAVNDVYSTLEDTTLNVAAAAGVLANDTDPDTAHASLTATLVTTTANGTLALNSNGSFTYIPNANFNGNDSFTYVTSDGALQSLPATVTIAVTSVNDAPSFTSGGNVTVLEDSGAFSAAWATAMNAGPGETQNLNFIVSNNNNALFSVQPSVSPSGVLTFTPAPNANGTATVTVQIHDDGGTANGGADTSAPQTFTITVTPVNDAPSFTKGPNQTVADTAGGQTVLNWATNLSAGPADEAGQLLNFIVSNNNNALFSTQPSILPDGTLLYMPALGQSGVATVTVQIHDNGGTANGGVDTSAPQTFTITVQMAPSITSANTTTFTLGTPGSFQVTTTGFPTPALSETGALPPGVTFVDNGNGTATLSGIASGPAITYPITINASNGVNPAASQSFNLIVVCPSISVINPLVGGGTASTPFSQQFTQSGGLGAVVFTTASTLPAGLTLSPNGLLSGTPTQTGSFPVVVQVTDSNGCTGTGSTYDLGIGCQTINVNNPSTTTGTVSTAFSQQFTQTGAIGTPTFTTASALPAGLSLSNTGVLSGAPTQSGTFSIFVDVTDGNGCTGTSASYDLVIACQTITVINPANATGPAGSPFSEVFTQSGAIGATTFTTSDPLPAGLTLGTDGTLSGTPTQGGTFPITVTVTDANGCPGVGPTYTLTITCPTITVTNPATTTATVGAPFTATFTQTGGQGTVSFTTTSTLPGGLTLATNGDLSGTPSQFGSFPIVVTATDQNGCIGTGSTYTLVISCPTITVTNPATTTGTAGTAFSQTFTQSGAFSTATFTTASTLPNGLTLSAGGVLSGTPTQTGSFPIVVTVTDAAGCTGTGSTYTLTLGCPTITVTVPGTTNGTVMSPFSQTFTQTGAVGTATFTTASTLPNGLTLGTDGTLSGTPMQPGSFPIVVTVTDSNGCTGTSATYNLFIFCQSIPIQPPVNTTGTVGTFYTETFVATNTIGTQTWSTTSTLPNGITLDSASGVLSGTPTQSGSFLILIAVKDSNNCQSSRSFTLTINCQTITVTNPNNTAGTVGAPFSEQFSQTGGIGATTFSTASTLPAGITLSPAGLLSGTPTQPGTFNIVVTATDSNGCTGTGATYSLVIACNVITVTNPATATGTVDAPFSQTFTQSGGNGTVTVTLNSGTLPSGLTLSATGVLSGTPGQPGNFPITVKATDANGCSGIGPTYTLVIACQTITVTNPGVTTGTVDAAFSQSFTQSGVGTHTPATFTANGSLPPGLTLSNAGLLSGTPSAPGSFSFTVTVTDVNGCSGTGATYTLVVACQTITVTNPGTSLGTYNTAFSQTFTQTGVGTHTPVTWSIVSGTLPTGLSLASSSGILSGTPVQTGSFPITLKVTDANGCSGTGGSYNLQIQPKLQNDSYGAVGNTQLVINGFSPAPGTPAVVNATTLLANDTADAVIVTGLSVAPTKGVVTVDTTGHFLYTPNVNATGTDTFTYSGTTNGVTANALVTITFNNMVWFVDNATGSLTNDGRSNTPFKTMTALNGAATNTGDFIYVAKGSGITTGAYTMKANQTLLGAGVNLSVAGLLFVAGTSTNTPTIGGTLTLASGVTIDGIDMSTGADAFLNVTAAVTGINVTARTVTATGGAVDINPSSGTSTGTLTFQTLNSNGGPRGVILRNFTGSLTVNGTGATAGSGGTIQNASNNGIELVNTGNITLKNMNLTNNAQVQTTSALSCGNPGVPPIDPSVCVANLFMNNVATVTLNNLAVSGSKQMGIAGKTVSALSLVNSNIHDNGDELYEDGLFFKDLTGTVSITGTTVKDNFTRQSDIENYTGSLTLTASGSLFGRVSTIPGINSNQGFFVLLANSAHLDIDMGTSTIQNNGNGNGLQINLQNSSTLGSAGLHSSMHNMTSLSGNAAHVFVNTASTAAGFFDTVNNAVMVNAGLQSIDYFAPGGSLTGIILGNTIGTSGVAASGCSAPGAGCDGMTIDQSGSGALSLRIDSNTIQQINTNGIAMGATQTGSLNASIINNTFRQPSGGPNQGNAMLFNVGANSGSTATACLNITGNLIQETSQTWDINGSGASIYFNTKNATVTRLPGYLGTSTNDAAFAAFVQGNNTFNLVGTIPVFSTRFNGSTYAGGAACSVP